jgi:hypothetical protein
VEFYFILKYSNIYRDRLKNTISKAPVQNTVQNTFWHLHHNAFNDAGAMTHKLVYFDKEAFSHN